MLELKLHGEGNTGRYLAYPRNLGDDLRFWEGERLEDTQLVQEEASLPMDCNSDVHFGDFLPFLSGLRQDLL